MTHQASACRIRSLTVCAVHPQLTAEYSAHPPPFVFVLTCLRGKRPVGSLRVLLNFMVSGELLIVTNEWND